MAIKKHFFISFAALALAAGLAGCATDSSRTPSPLAVNLDEGVLIANTGNVGPTNAKRVTDTPSDCEAGKGLGITVHSATQDDKYLFDRQGNPCPKADVMFDGSQKAFQRSAALGVDISFSDPFAEQMLPEDRGFDDDDIPEINLSGDDIELPHTALANPDMVAGVPAPESHEELRQNPDDMPPEIAAMADELKDADPLNENLQKTIKGWKASEDRERLLRETEDILADVRTVKRVANLEQIRQQQDRMLELTAMLREAERKAQLHKEQKERLQAAARKKTSLLENKTTVKNLENNKLRQQVETLQARIEDFDRYNKRLKDQYEQRQQALQKRIADLSADLKETETRSKAARQAAIMQAATQIAEAERLAFAAQVSQRQELEMEAERLQMQALKLSDKAQGLPDEVPDDLGPEGLDRVYSDMVSGRIRDADIERLANIVINGRATAESLGDATFALEAQDLPLKEIFALIVADVEDMAGSWRISWQLRPKNSHIPEEEWTVTAESTVNDFISYVARQVYKAHNVKLAFKMFGKNRVVVITETE